MGVRRINYFMLRIFFIHLIVFFNSFQMLTLKRNIRISGIVQIPTVLFPGDRF